ncbi:hypothetical protein F5Y05DRAFT_386599 [Hypoxylon sp. FL0543]|nr:hypothetical protein F5Y05DRAFT_386599 [Hypoxylon sp. FL0543]
MSSRYPKRKRPATDYAAMAGKKPRTSAQPPAYELQPSVESVSDEQPEQPESPTAEEAQAEAERIAYELDYGYSLTRPVGEYPLREAVESMAIVLNFIEEVNVGASIDLNRLETVLKWLDYGDERWDDKRINWEEAIVLAHERMRETAELLYELKVLDFTDLMYHLLNFSRNLYARGVEIL